jgi:hypothetical protein
VSISATLLLGQSLRVPPSETGLDTPGTFSMVIDSPQNQAPLALQWDFSVPPVIVIRPADIVVGKAAESAGKSLTCAIRDAKGGASRRMRYTCILAGGRDPIGDGPVAVVQYRAQWDVRGAPVQVAIENVIGVSRDLKRIPMSNVDVAINIR